MNHPIAIGLGLALGLASIFGATHTAKAVEIRTIQYFGTVDELDPERDGNPLSEFFSLGDPISLQLSFDANTPDADPANSRGRYPDAITGVTLTIGPHTYTLGSGANLLFLVDVPPGAPAVDQFSVDAVLDGPNLGGLNAETIRLIVSITDRTGAMFSSDSLPVVTPISVAGTRFLNLFHRLGPSDVINCPCTSDLMAGGRELTFEKSLTFGPKVLDSIALVDAPEADTGQILINYDRSQFFAFTIDLTNSGGPESAGFVLSDSVARFAEPSGDGESAADDPAGLMIVGGPCADGVCDGIKVEVEPPGASCVAEFVDPEPFGREFDAGAVIVSRFGSDIEPVEPGDRCRVTVFVETIRSGDDDDDDEFSRFEPKEALELIAVGDTPIDDWPTLNNGFKVYDGADGRLIEGPVGAIALEPVQGAIPQPDDDDDD